MTTNTHIRFIYASDDESVSNDPTYTPSDDEDEVHSDGESVSNDPTFTPSDDEDEVHSDGESVSNDPTFTPSDEDPSDDESFNDSETDYKNLATTIQQLRRKDLDIQVSRCKMIKSLVHLYYNGDTQGRKLATDQLKKLISTDQKVQNIRRKTREILDDMILDVPTATQIKPIHTKKWRFWQNCAVMAMAPLAVLATFQNMM